MSVERIDTAMIIGSGASGGASRPSVSQNSNEGIGGGGGSDGVAKGVLVMLGLLGAFFLYLYLLG